MEKFIGKKVIVRANGAGVFFGELVAKDGDCVELKNARKIWRWYNACGVEQIASDGIGKESYVTVKVESIIVEKVIQILICTEKAINCLEEFKEWEK